MKASGQDFLRAVAGADGASALLEAAGRSAEAVLPRAVLAWLGVAGEVGHSGPLPGVASVRLELAKAGDGYSGRVDIGGSPYDFSNADLSRVAGAVSVALGARRTPFPAGGESFAWARAWTSSFALAR